MPEDIQSRFIVYERPHALPGKCCVCGASDRPVVDFGRDIEWDNGYGRAYFCVTCIKQAASKFPDPVKENDHDLMVRHVELWKKDYVDELRTRILECIPGPADIPVDGTSNPVPEQTEPDDTTDPEPDKPEFSGISDETDQPTSEQGTSGVPSFSSVGLFPDIFSK
jgi:hypothetical protein